MAATFSLSGTLKVVPKWVDARGATDVTDTAIATHTAALTDGTGAGSANCYWKDQITIAAGATATIDLRALPAKAFGGTGSLVLSAVKMLLVVSDSAVSVGGSASNRWSSFSAGEISVGPGDVLYSTNASSGWAVSSSSRTIAISNAGTSAATVAVYVAGVQA